MYDDEVRAVARAAIASGESLNSISKCLGISRSTLRDWRDHPDHKARSSDCPRCRDGQLPGTDYGHLLGLYLGDGCLSALKKDVYSLRIACDDRYPRLIDEAAAAISALHPSRPVHRVQAIGCTSVVSYWKHWPCLFPQHGPGLKHLRKIELREWQEVIVQKCSGEFAKGLFHSDGWRGVNRVRRPLADGDHWYEYPRYQFGNESRDILRLCGEALDQLGVEWRYSRRNTISVARWEAVARLDEFVGPKY
jgi:hypothetical protein